MHEEKGSQKTNEDQIANRSVRLSDSAHKRLKELSDVRGKSFDELQKELIALYDRVTLQDDEEFGSQIGQVNDLLDRVGNKFASMVQHANTKLENQEEQFQKFKVSADEERKELRDKIKSLTDELKEKEEENKSLIEKEQDASLARWKAENQLSKQQKKDEERITELKDVINSKNEKIVDKNNKIDNLEKQIESIRNDISQNEELKLTIKMNDEEIERLKNEIEKQAEKYAVEVATKEFKHKEEVLEKERIHQYKIVEISETNNNRIQAMYDEMISIRKEYDKKIEALQRKLDKVNETPSQTRIFNDTDQ